MKVEGEEEEKELRLEEAAPVAGAGVGEEAEAAKRAFGYDSFPPLAGSLAATKDALFIACADGGILRVTAVKPAGRRAMSAGAWSNGLGGKKVFAVEVEKEKKKGG